MSMLTVRSHAGKVALVAVAVGVSMVSGVANAAIDTSSITSGITDAATAVGVIGAAAVLVVLAVKTYKWLARAL
jgi:hypothetical protein